MLPRLQEWSKSLQNYLCPVRQGEYLSICFMENSLRAVLYSPEEGVSFSWEKAFEYGLDMDKGMLVKQLETAWRELQEKLGEEDYELSKCRTMLTLADFCYREELELPNLEEKELQETLAWEVTQHVPWQEGSYVWRARRVQANPEEMEEDGVQNIHMEIFALPAELVQHLLMLSDELQQSLCGVSVAEGLDVISSGQLETIDFYERFYNQEEIRKLRNQYAVAIAAVLQYCARGEYINFLPEEQQKSILLAGYRPLLQRASLLFLGLSMLIGLSGYCWEWYSARELRQMQARQAAMSIWEQRLHHTQHLQKEIDLLSRERARLEEKKISWSRQLRLLASHIPEGCWLIKVREKSRQELILQGAAEHSRLLNKFVESLNKDKIYKSIELLHMEQREEKGRQIYAYTLRLFLGDKLKEKSSGAAK